MKALSFGILISFILSFSMVQAEVYELPRECFDIQDGVLVGIHFIYPPGQGDICKHFGKHLVIPEGVRGIAGKRGSGVFWARGLTGVELPETLEFIEDRTFAYNNITEINLPAGLKHIGDQAFRANGIKSLKLNSALRHIGASAFQNNQIQGELIFPRKLTGLGEKSFYGNKLQSISFLGEELVEIGASAFLGNRLKRLVLPDGLKKIGSGAFDWNLLEQVRLPESLVEIGGSAFAGSAEGTRQNYPRNHIKELVIPENVEFIGGYAFQWVGIEKLVFKGSKLQIIKANAFRDNRIEELILPNSLRVIGAEAFQSNKIQKLTLSANLQYLGHGSFSWNSLSEFDLNLPSTLVDMCDSAFYQTRAQDSIVIPDSTRVHDCRYSSIDLDWEI